MLFAPLVAIIIVLQKGRRPFGSILSNIFILLSHDDLTLLYFPMPYWWQAGQLAHHYFHRTSHTYAFLIWSFHFCCWKEMIKCVWLYGTYRISSLKVLNPNVQFQNMSIPPPQKKFFLRFTAPRKFQSLLWVEYGNFLELQNIMIVKTNGNPLISLRCWRTFRGRWYRGRWYWIPNLNLTRSYPLQLVINKINNYTAVMLLYTLQ